MTIEITSISLDKGIINISAVDISEENLQRFERIRDDGVEQELEFIFDTHQEDEFRYLRAWLKRQKATKGCSTWGEALNAVIGTITTISGRYRSWE